MLNIFQDEDLIQFTLSSEIKMVNDVVQNVRGYLKQYSIEDEKAFILTLRELLNNAIEHGNRKNQSLNVVVSIRCIGDMRFKLIVEDEGKGFDHKNANLMMTDNPNQGLSLVNAFSDQLEFNSKGNCVTVHMTIRQETEFSLSDDKPWKIIRPASDISAETAEKFRSLLLDLLNNDHRKYRFDLSDVKDMDSVILSIFVIFSDMVSERFPDAELKIINANKDIANLFRMTHLDDAYHISCRFSDN